MLNVLLRRRSIARTSRTPGRTQAINLFRVGDAIVFADLPGYGFARVPEHVRLAWGPMVEGYLGERSALYQSQLMRVSAANTQASLNAYQSGVTEFTTLMRARITELDVRLDDLRVRVDRAKAHASLLYLTGEDR